MKWINLLTILCLTGFVLTTGCRQASGPQSLHFSSETPLQPNAKHMIVLIIDSLMDKPLLDAIRSNHAPALKFLKMHGQYYSGMVSSFPTMSVTIDSSLLTGEYAGFHRIPGLVWYRDEEKRIVNYGSGLKDVIKQGPIQVLLDAFHGLNMDHLNPKIRTLFEELADKGKTSASINMFVYRGRSEHSLRLPDAIAQAANLPHDMKALGPDRLSLGIVSHQNPSQTLNAFLWQHYGINDSFSADELIYLIQKKQLPDVSFVYFPDNDLLIHEKGPQVLEGIEHTDEQMAHILNSFGNWENALDNTIWIILGDSGQTGIGKDTDRSVIRLPELFDRYRISQSIPPTGRKVGRNDSILFAINERMAYVYAVDRQLPLSDMIQRLQQENRIDVIAWKHDQFIHVKTSSKNSEFIYQPHGKFVDEYGQTWSMKGDPGLLDVSVSGHRIQYGNYPDALARLYGALHSHDGRFIVITAKPGYEFADDSSPVHPGGAGHGSLHKQDSLVPLIIVGTHSAPKHLRIVDLKNWLLQLLDEI